MSGTFAASLNVRTMPVVVGIASPPSQLLLFAGIETFFDTKGQILGNCDSQTSRMTLTLHLQRTATRILQWSSTAALASIRSDEGDWLLAVDSSEVRLDPTTGELLLVVELAATGEDGLTGSSSCAYINRISYTAHVLVDIQAPLIAGTVRWSAADFHAQDWPALTVVAGYWVSTPGGPGMFGTSTWVIVATGILDQPILSGGIFSSSYVIQGVPFGTSVQVLATSLPNFKASAQLASPGFTREHNTTDPIILTPGQPQQLDVDFVAKPVFGPR